MSKGSKKISNTWHLQAVMIVDELLPVVDAKHWDMLLDLRILLLSRTNWKQVLDLFLRCRQQMELDHYLPFYRLRMLLANSLQLEAGASTPSLVKLLRKKHRSLEDLRSVLERERFEHDLTATGSCIPDLKVCEKSF